MTKFEKRFQEILPQYLEAYKNANGKEFEDKIIYRKGFVIQCIGERGFRVRIAEFERWLENLKKRNQSK